MTAFSPAPAPPQGIYVPGAAEVPAPAQVPVQGQVPAPRQPRLDRAQVWTIVVAAVIALVAGIVGAAVSGGDSSGDAARQLFGGDSDYSDYYGGYDLGDYDSDCYDAFC